MKTFYVLFDGVRYLSFNPKTLSNEIVLPNGTRSWLWSAKIGEAEQFESLCQALEFMQSSGLQVEVLRIDVTSVYTPNLGTRVVIMESDGSQYLEKMMAHNHSAYLTPQKDEAMVFDNRDQAVAFLRKCGHNLANWIIQSV